MSTSCPPKSQTLRPGVGPPTESKAQSKPKRPPPALPCFFVGGAPSRRMRASYPAKSQKLRPGGGPPTESKLKSKPKRPPPAATCFFVGAAPSRRMRASYPAKSQKLRPGVGPPTESKAQKQTKAPTARTALLFCGRRALAANAGDSPPTETTILSAQPAAAGRSSPQSHPQAHSHSPLRAAIPEPADNRPAPPP